MDNNGANDYAALLVLLQGANFNEPISSFSKHNNLNWEELKDALSGAGLGFKKDKFTISGDNYETLTLKTPEDLKKFEAIRAGEITAADLQANAQTPVSPAEVQSPLGIATQVISDKKWRTYENSLVSDSNGKPDLELQQSLDAAGVGYEVKEFTPNNRPDSTTLYSVVVSDSNDVEFVQRIESGELNSTDVENQVAMDEVVAQQEAGSVNVWENTQRPLDVGGHNVDSKGSLGCNVKTADSQKLLTAEHAATLAVDTVKLAEVAPEPDLNMIRDGVGVQNWQKDVGSGVRLLSTRASPIDDMKAELEKAGIEVESRVSEVMGAKIYSLHVPLGEDGANMDKMNEILNPDDTLAPTPQNIASTFTL